MAVLPLVIAPDPILSRVSESVTNIDESLQKLCDDMLDTMYMENGIGLSAVQVGFLRRIITVDIDQERHDNGTLKTKGNQYIMINPEIISRSSAFKNYNEGCLSFPGVGVSIDRPDIITVQYTDLSGKKCLLEAGGLLSICIQHEIDHLNGITIDSYLSPLRRGMVIKKLEKIKRRPKL